MAAYKYNDVRKNVQVIKKKKKKEKEKRKRTTIQCVRNHKVIAQTNQKY